jgi:hypothetical protein
MAIEILHRYTKAVLYRSETANTIGEAVIEALAMEEKPNLSGSDLSYSNLSGSDLRCSNLRCSDLSGSNLSGSDLSGSDLRGSNLSYSNLSYSNLRGSNLSGSDLRGSDLSGSNLSGSGVILMQCGIWQVVCDPEFCRVGCQKHLHEVWFAATPESVSSWHCDAAEWWRHWGEVIKAACVACAKHGWPKAKAKEEAAAK